MANPSSNRYDNDAPGSPQTVVWMTRKSGDRCSTDVVLGADGKSFRVVLDDARHPIEPGETIETAATRQAAAMTRRIWPDDEQYQIVTE